MQALGLTLVGVVALTAYTCSAVVKGRHVSLLSPWLFSSAPSFPCSLLNIPCMIGYWCPEEPCATDLYGHEVRSSSSSVVRQICQLPLPATKGSDEWHLYAEQIN